MTNHPWLIKISGAHTKNLQSLKMTHYIFCHCASITSCPKTLGYIIHHILINFRFSNKTMMTLFFIKLRGILHQEQDRFWLALYLEKPDAFSKIIKQSQSIRQRNVIRNSQQLWSCSKLCILLSRENFNTN